MAQIHLVHYWGGCAHPEVMFWVRCAVEVATKHFNIFQALIPVLLPDRAQYCPLLFLALPKCTQQLRLILKINRIALFSFGCSMPLHKHSQKKKKKFSVLFIFVLLNTVVGWEILWSNPTLTFPPFFFHKFLYITQSVQIRGHR